jgi:hypothetical protein
MAVGAAETGTADFQSTFKRMASFTLTAGADAAVVNLREGSVSGTIKFVVKAAIQGTTHLDFPIFVSSATGNWYVELASGTTPQMTITGG